MHRCWGQISEATNAGVRMTRGVSRTTLVSFGDAVLRRSPLQIAQMRRSKRTLTVLAYHDVRDAAVFSRHIDTLTRRFTPVSLEQVIDHVESRASLPTRSVLVTFDDGDPSVLETAAPILSARGIPAVAFVVAGYLGTSEPFWWEQVEFAIRHGGRSDRLPTSTPHEAVRYLKTTDDATRLATVDELRSSATQPLPPRHHLDPSDLLTLERLGVAVGNHTLTHPLLDRCPPEKVEEEVFGAHHRLSSILGHPPTAFAYPNGNTASHARDAVRSLGYRAAFLFDHLPQPLPIAEPYGISRLRVGSELSDDRFAIITSGLHPALHRAAHRP